MIAYRRERTNNCQALDKTPNPRCNATVLDTATSFSQAETDVMRDRASAVRPTYVHSAHISNCRLKSCGRSADAL